MDEVTIETLMEVNNFIENGNKYFYLSDVLEAIEEIAYEKQRSATSDEIIYFMENGEIK